MTDQAAEPANPQKTTRQKAQASVPFVAASGLLGIAFSLAGLLLLVRYLPQDEYGVWVLLTGLTAPVSVFTAMGFQHAILRFIPALAEGPERGALVWPIVAGRLITATCAAIALVVGFPWIGPTFGLEDHLATYIAVQPAIVALCASIHVTAALNAAFRQREVFLASFVQQMLLLIGVVAGIATQQDLLYFTCVHSIVSIVHLAVSVAYCARFYGWPRLRGLGKRSPEVQEVRRYRRTSYVNDVLESFLTPDLSRYLLAAFSTTVEVAVFSVATSIMSRLRAFQPLGLFRPLASVALFERFEQTDSIDELYRGFRFVYAVNNLVTVFYVALFLPLGAQALAWVFREEYVTAYLPTVFLFASLGVFGLPVGLLAKALQRPQYQIYAKAAVLVNVGLGVPLSIEYGASGMAFAVMAGVFVRNVLTYLLLRFEFQVRFPWRTFLRFSLAGTAAAATTWLIADLLPLLISGALGSLAYVCATRIFGVLSARERSLLVSLAPERVRIPIRLVVGG